MKSRIKYLRKKNNLSKVGLADITGVISQSQLSRVENEKLDAQLTTKQAIELAAFFGVSIDYLLCQSDDPSPKVPILYQKVPPEEKKYTLKEILEQYSGIDIVVNYQEDNIIIIQDALTSNSKKHTYRKIKKEKE